MNKKITLSFISAMVALIVIDACNNNVSSNGGGAPAARTGSPFDNAGVACNVGGCHTRPAAATQAGWITSNIPGTGYIPDTTYNIAAAENNSRKIMVRFAVMK